MNVLINTPLLKDTSLKEDFDNKVLVIFLFILSFLVILGLLFFDLIGVFSKSSPVNNDNSEENSPQLTIYA